MRRPRLFEVEPQRQLHRLEMRTERVENLRRKAREQTVLSGIGSHVTLAHGREQKEVSQSLAPGGSRRVVLLRYAYFLRKDT
jgi:hypothetical protein